MIAFGKKTYIVAGLITSLAVGAAVSAAPTKAIAGELAIIDSAESMSSGQAPIDVDNFQDKAASSSETIDSSLKSDSPSAAKDGESSASADNEMLEIGQELHDPAKADAADVPEHEDESAPSVPLDSIDDVDGGAEADASVPNDAEGITDSKVASSESEEANETEVTSAPAERGWSSDGLSYSDGSGTAYTGWVVDNHEGNGLERYWVSDGKLFKNGLFDSRDGNFGYALSNGRVLRQRFTDALGNIFFADNDGRLAGGSTGGWVVSSAYGQGLQRYWIDPVLHAAIVGYNDGSTYSELNNWAHYTLGEGYVLRNGAKREGKRVYLADNDGKLISANGSSGWVVTSEYGQGLQRYWAEKGGYAKIGYSEDGWTHFTTDQGYVLRDAQKTSDGEYRIANNDGVLVKSGWVVTSGFTGGLERYWFENGAAVRSRLVHADGDWWTYARGDGRVVRGSYDAGDGRVYLADNDGRLAGGSVGGWVVSSVYGQGLQRYWIDPVTHSAIKGLDDGSNNHALNNWAHFTCNEGYVLRGKWDNGAGYVYLADNDGALPTVSGWVVTAKYDGGLQRYWIDGDKLAAKSGFFSVGGQKYFGIGGQGFVSRGKTGWGNQVLLSDNDGVLNSTNGWLVTSKYDGAPQRYWMQMIQGVRDFFGAVTGWFSVSGSDYYGYANEGYVMRNTVTRKNGHGWYWADNDGKVTYLSTGKIGYQNPSGYYQVSAHDVSLPYYASGYHTYVTPSRISPDATRGQVVEAFIGRAYDYLGTDYKWNYSSWPGDGVDCVGLVYQCAYAVGMDMGEFNPYDHYATGSNGWHSHDANNLWNYGAVAHVGLGDRMRGDVISWEGHVAIYLGGDQIIEANSGGVKISSLWAYGTPRGAMRFFQ